MGRHRIGIVGGGITGLVAAYRLVQSGADVTIFEAGSELGGLASGFTLAGHSIEKAYHFLYRTDEYILGLVKELALEDKLTFHPSSVSTYYDGTVYPMMSPMDLIKFTPLSFIDRIRAGVTVVALQRVRDWRKLSKITALEWLRRYAGRKVSDVIWEPLLRGKFDRYFDKVTMSWLWGRVKQRVDSRDPKLGGEALGYFDGGFRIIIDELVARIRAGGGNILLNTPVQSLQHDGAQVILATQSGQERFDRVLATTPSHVLANLCQSYEEKDPAYFQKLRSIDYLDACVHVFATPQKFTPYYWHNINTPNAPFVVFLSLTNLVDAKRFKGLNIYYVGDYIPAEHRYMHMDPSELKTLWYAELKKIFPDFDPAQVVDDAVFRLRNAQHIVDIGFEENKLLPYETPCPGVFLCNFSQIYPMDRGTNYAVRDGDRMATLVRDSLEKSRAGAVTMPPVTISGRVEDAAETETKKKRLPNGLIGAAAAGAALAFAGAAFFGGFAVATHELPPAALLSKVDRKLLSLAGRDVEQAVEVPATISTTLLSLAAETTRLPMDEIDPLTGGPIEGEGGGITALGDDTIIILGYDGRIYAARKGEGLRPTKVRGPENHRADYHAFATAPENAAQYDFANGYLRYNDLLAYETQTRRGLLAAYVEYHPKDQCYTNSVAELPLPKEFRSIDEVAAGPSDWRVVFRTQPCLPFKREYLAMEGHVSGGRLAFVPPSTIYLTSGDFHFDGMRSKSPAIAQDPTAQYGKVLKIDLASGAGRIVSMGHRNLQGLVVDDDGRVLVTEHGPKGGDELNQIREGANYGWPLESYGVTYGGLRIPGSLSYGRQDEFTPPIFSWIPSPAISGLTIVKGFDPAWDGDLLASSLAGQSLYRVRMQNGRPVYSEQIPLGVRIRNVHQAPDGRIVLLLTDNRVVFLTAQQNNIEYGYVTNIIAEAKISEPLRQRVQQTIDGCIECHSLSAHVNDKAPSLARVFGADIASTAFAGYSDALKGLPGSWSRERLAAYLDDPQAYAPGTHMPDPNLDDPETSQKVIDVLQEMSTWF